MDTGIEKCVANFVFTTQSIHGTIRELRRHQRRKKDGQEIARNFLVYQKSVFLSYWSLQSQHTYMQCQDLACQMHNQNLLGS